MRLPRIKKLFSAFIIIFSATKVVAGGEPMQGLVHRHIPRLVTFAVDKILEQPSPAMKEALDYILRYKKEPKGRLFDFTDDQERKLLIKANSNTLKEWVRYKEKLANYNQHPRSDYISPINTESFWLGMYKDQPNTLALQWFLDTEAKRSFMEHTDAPHNTAFVFASFLGAIGYVEKHLRAGVDIHAYNEFALQCAAQEGHTEVIQLLLDYGAQASSYGALESAIQKSHVKTVNILLEHRAIRNEQRLKSCLGYAMVYEYDALIKALITYGVEVFGLHADDLNALREMPVMYAYEE